MIEIRKGQAPDPIDRTEFGERFRAAYIDPAFRDREIAVRGPIATGSYYNRPAATAHNMHAMAQANVSDAHGRFVMATG